MKNSLRTCTIRHFSLLLITCSVSAFSVQSMEPASEQDSLTTHSISIADVDRKELSKALYDYAMKTVCAQAESSESVQNVTAGVTRRPSFSDFVIGLSKRLSSASSDIFTESKSPKEYDKKLERFIAEYELNFTDYSGNPCALSVAHYDSVYGEGAAERVYDDFVERTKNLRFAEEVLTKLQRKSSKESQASAGLLGKASEEVVTICLSPILSPLEEGK